MLAIDMKFYEPSDNAGEVAWSCYVTLLQKKGCIIIVTYYRFTFIPIFFKPFPINKHNVLYNYWPKRGKLYEFK